MNEVIENEVVLETEETILRNEEKNDSQTEVSDFLPMQIGDIDSREQNKSDVAYYAICESLTNLKEAVEELLLKEDRFSIDIFFEFLNSDPRKWIFKKYISINGNPFPMVDADQMFELKIIKVEGIEPVLELHKQFSKALENVKNCGFFYPLKKLYDADRHFFLLTTDFCIEQEKRFSRWTQTNEQNEILKKFNRLASLLNELNELNICRAKNGPDEIKMLSDYIDIDLTSSKGPFIVDNVLFYKHRLQNYRIKDFAYRNMPKFEHILL